VKKSELQDNIAAYCRTNTGRHANLLGEDYAQWLMDLCLLLCGFEGDLRKLHGLKVEQRSHIESWTP